MHIKKSHLLLSALLVSATAVMAQTSTDIPSQTSGLQWQTDGAAQHVCGGVSDEDMSAIKTYRSSANGELLFTGGTQGAYLANVDITIHGKHLSSPLSFMADGPVCLLRLPKGNYVVDAVYQGVEIKKNIQINGTRQKTQFRWSAY
ncbi:MAG TPA: hypothetical protein VL550_10450 [Rhodocyclaceae bacterium]|jgi:hypothetical protein|nr:hypothetical protein [Rhodocyclaceae bacterium]